MDLFPKKPKFNQRLISLEGQVDKQLKGLSLAWRFARGVLSTLEDYSYLSQRRQNEPYPLLKLQSHLLQDLILWEHAVANYKKQQREATSKLEVNPQDVSIKELIDALQGEIVVNQNHAKAIRDIGDGLAWRLFKYDRCALYALADRPARKHIDLIGLTAELVTFEQQYSSMKAITILNDLTHCLKLGDLTTRLDDDTFEISEVKTDGKKSGRILRQRQAMRETVSFLNTGKGDVAGMPVETQLFNLTPKTFFPEFRALLEKSQSDCVADAAFGDHLHVVAMDASQFKEVDLERLKPIIESAFDRAMAPESKGDRIIGNKSADRYEFVRNFAPYSVYPIPHLARAKLASGALVLVQCFNASAFIRYMAGFGWQVTKPLEAFEKEAGDQHPVAFATFTKGPLSVNLPWTWIGRMSTEYLQPKTVVELLEAVYAAGPDNVRFSAMELSGEASIWD